MILQHKASVLAVEMIDTLDKAIIPAVADSLKHRLGAVQFASTLARVDLPFPVLPMSINVRVCLAYEAIEMIAIVKIEKKIECWMHSSQRISGNTYVAYKKIRSKKKKGKKERGRAKDSNI